MPPGQTQGAGTVSTLVPALPHQLCHSWDRPREGTHTGWLPLLWLFSPGLPSHIPALHSSSCWKPSRPNPSQWHQLYPVYQEKPHPAGE